MMWLSVMEGSNNVDGDLLSMAFGRSVVMNSKNYMIAIGVKESMKVIPFFAWKSITIKDKINWKNRQFVIPFDEITNSLINSWIQLNDPRLSNILNNEDVIFLLKSFINRGPLGMRKAGNNLRVLNNRACEALLKNIHRNDQTQSWLTDLLSGS